MQISSPTLILGLRCGWMFTVTIISDCAGDRRVGLCGSGFWGGGGTLVWSYWFGSVDCVEEVSLSHYFIRSIIPIFFLEVCVTFFFSSFFFSFFSQWQQLAERLADRIERAKGKYNLFFEVCLLSVNPPAAAQAFFFFFCLLQVHSETWEKHQTILRRAF